MNTSISASWLLKGYFNLRGQDPKRNTSQEVRRELCAALKLPQMALASFPVGPGWRHVFWWRETDVDFAEAQFVASISEEYPMLSLGISVEKGRKTPTKNRPAIDRTWDWHKLVKHLPDVLAGIVAAVGDDLKQPLNLRITSKAVDTPDTSGWKTRGFSFVDGEWFQRHVGGVSAKDIADYILELHEDDETWVIVTFTRDLSPSEANGMSPAAVSDILVKFNPLRERLRGRAPSGSRSRAKAP